MNIHSGFPCSSPESQGVSSRAIQSFLDAIEDRRLGVHSFLLVRHGIAVAQGWWKPYASYLPHIMFSVSKSFTATAIGIAAAEGKLSLDDPVLTFFPTYATDEIRENMAAVQVRHLLSMSTGHAEDTMVSMRSEWGAGDWIRIFLSAPIQHTPGTHFLYNSGASYVLSAIVQSVTGQTVAEFLGPRLFEPLGMHPPLWQKSPMGVNLGASGLRIRTDDLAKFGQLYLQNGMWNGQRILPERWVKEASRSHVSNGDDAENDWNQGYGYQIWRCRHNAYRADGAFGQMCLVMPEQDAVLALTSGILQLKEPLNAVWEHLLPGMRDNPLPVSPTTEYGLRDRQARLALPVPRTIAIDPPMAEVVNNQIIELETNDLRAAKVSLSFAAGCTTCTFEDNDGHQHTIQCGRTDWIAGESALWHYEEPPAPVKLAARGGWLDEFEFVMTWQYTEMPFRHTITFDFSGGEVNVGIHLDLPFWVERAAQLRGRFVARA